MSEQSGDSYGRTFIGDRAKCGCRWERLPGVGDVLRECRLHAQATRASVAKFEREHPAPHSGVDTFADEIWGLDPIAAVETVKA